MQVAFYGANVMGLREGRVLQEGTSLIKVLMLLAFAGAAIAVAGPHEAAGAGSSVSVTFGWIAVIGAYSLIKGAYAGYDAPVYFTEENEQPASSIPRALGIGLLVTAVLYVAINAVAALRPGRQGHGGDTPAVQHRARPYRRNAGPPSCLRSVLWSRSPVSSMRAS